MARVGKRMGAQGELACRTLGRRGTKLLLHVSSCPAGCTTPPAHWLRHASFARVLLGVVCHGLPACATSSCDFRLFWSPGAPTQCACVTLSTGSRPALQARYFHRTMRPRGRLGASCLCVCLCFLVRCFERCRAAGGLPAGVGNEGKCRENASIVIRVGSSQTDL